MLQFSSIPEQGNLYVLFMNHWALKWRLDPNIISVWSISWIGRENLYKLGQVDTKYIILPWGHYNKQCSAAPTYGAFLLSVRTSWLEGWRAESPGPELPPPSLNVFSCVGRQQDFFPALYSLAWLISCFRMIQAELGSTLYFSSLQTFLPTLFISSQQSHFVRAGHLLSTAVQSLIMSSVSLLGHHSARVSSCSKLINQIKSSVDKKLANCILHR